MAERFIEVEVPESIMKTFGDQSLDCPRSVTDAIYQKDRHTLICGLEKAGLIDVGDVVALCFVPSPNLVSDTHHRIVTISEASIAHGRLLVGRQLHKKTLEIICKFANN
jgi:hypothetical protein